MPDNPIERNSLIVGLSDVEDNVRLNNTVMKRKVTSLFDSVSVVCTNNKSQRSTRKDTLTKYAFVTVIL